ncbi:uncharacterized protein LOC111709628 [Eurytemora carolleeae]|uniref:uncharacterized protein LOC111709628 n=1 Tax=Eurytemora carolleeae TaxID=1294199 RepID=UPI000C78C02D|nr:uncharacterized protein LOC111709628 [Eurytemora carolleeae]|eukprot:XP_023339147.1 uncharacterized protein LOC111709628 [Eurytemora affinis]
MEGSDFLRVLQTEIDILFNIMKYLEVSDVFSLEVSHESIGRYIGENNMWKKYFEAIKFKNRKLDDFEKRWRACKQRRIEKEEKRRERKRLKKSIEDSDDECLIIDESLDEEEPPADDYRQILKTWAKTQENWRTGRFSEISLAVNFNRGHNYLLNAENLIVSETEIGLTNTRHQSDVSKGILKITSEQGSYTTLVLNNKVWIRLQQLPEPELIICHLDQCTEEQRFRVRSTDFCSIRPDSCTWSYTDPFLVRLTDRMRCDMVRLEGGGNCSPQLFNVSLAAPGNPRLSDILAVSDSGFILSTDDNRSTSYLWNISGIHSRTKVHQSWMHNLPFSFPPLNILSTALKIPHCLLGTSGGKVNIFNVETNSLIHTLYHGNEKGDPKPVQLIKLLKQFILTYSGSETVRVWDSELAFSQQSKHSKALVWKRDMRHGEILDLDGNQTQILSLENRQGEFKLVVRDFFSSDKETMERREPEDDKRRKSRKEN